jgi:hypothetical protein
MDVGSSGSNNHDIQGIIRHSGKNSERSKQSNYVIWQDI